MGRKLWKRSAAVVLMLIVLSTGVVANAEGSYTDTIPAAETVSGDAVLTLEQWTMSEECKTIEVMLNEILPEFGMIVELKADGNTLVFVYHLTREIWGDLTAEEMSSMGMSSDPGNMTAWLSEIVEEFGRQFNDAYGIKLDGICYIYVAPDSVPFYSIVIENGQKD